jgi:hypothetical protein
MNGIWSSLLWLLLAAVIGVVGSSLWTDYSFQILTIVVFLNAMATITGQPTAEPMPCFIIKSASAKSKFALRNN